MWPVEPVDNLVVVCIEERWERVRVLLAPHNSSLGEFPGVPNDVRMVEVVAGSRRAFLTASKIEYPRVRSPWTKRRTSRIREIRKL